MIIPGSMLYIRHTLEMSYGIVFHILKKLQQKRRQTRASSVLLVPLSITDDRSVTGRSNFFPGTAVFCPKIYFQPLHANDSN